MAKPEPDPILDNVDEAAERSFVGCVLRTTGACIPDVADLCLPEYLWDDRLRSVYRACLDGFERGEPLDLVTLRRQLSATPAAGGERSRFKDKLEEVGGAVFLVDVAEAAPSTAHVVGYAKIVRALYFKRQTINELRAAVADLETQGGSGEEWFRAAEDRLASIAAAVGGNTAQQSTPLGTIGDQVFASDGEQIIRTACEAIDADWDGVGEGNVLMVAGRPSMGKSTFAMNLTVSLARLGRRVAIYSLEMMPKDWWSWTIGHSAQVPSKSILRKRISAEQLAIVKRENDKPEFRERMLLQKRTSDVRTIAGDIRRLARSEGVTVALVDYLQLMTTGRKAQSEYERVTEVSRRITEAAKVSGVLLLAVCQLNRGNENTLRYTPIQKKPGTNGRGPLWQQKPVGSEEAEAAKKYREPSYPRMSDLRGSGALEQDGDMILMVHQPLREDAERIDPRYHLHARLEAVKSRTGPVGIRWMKFEPEVSTFRLMEKGFNPLTAQPDLSTSRWDRQQDINDAVEEPPADYYDEQGVLL